MSDSLESEHAFSSSDPDFGKRLGVISMLVRIYVLSRISHLGQALSIVRRRAGILVDVHSARRPDEFEGAFAAMVRRHAGALFVFGDPLFGVHRARLVDLAARNRLPAMYTNRPFVEAGGLMCYGPSFPDLWRRAASYVDKLLKGTKAANLPVEQPTKFEFVINLKTADALGLTIPPSILAAPS